MKWTWRTKTLEQVKDAVAKSTSYCQALNRLELRAAGGNYASLKRAIKEHNIDASHFRGQGWRKGRTFPPKRCLEEYLTNKFPLQSHKLRLRLLSEGVFKPVCSNCKRKTWLGSPIPLELEHINGDNLDNSLTNLCLLCPNCHALTPTYRGKNKGKPSP